MTVYTVDGTVQQADKYSLIRIYRQVFIQVIATLSHIQANNQLW